MAAKFTLTPRTAFDGLLSTDSTGAVSVVEREGLAFATVQARKGQAAEVAARVHSNFALELPARGRRANDNGVAFAAIAPGTWLASCEAAGSAFVNALLHSLGDAASVAEQGDGLGVLRISGPRARGLLARLVPIDVHARAFEVGDVAASNAGHIGITFWRLEDASDGTPTFEIALYRSFAESFAALIKEVTAGLA